MNSSRSQYEGDPLSFSSDPTLIAQMADLLSIPRPQGREWRAATVVFYATEDESLFATQLQHVQDVRLPQGAHQLLLLARQIIDAQLKEIDES